ncbi:hypothetical protein SRIMM317S_05452 [Streptomyces rimosus subsp. rimosus]
MQGVRQYAVPHRQDHLDDARDTGGGLGVAEVGLHRAEQQRALGGPALAVGGEEGLGLDGVAEGGAGAVGLDGVDVGGGQLGVGQGLADDALLGRAVGRGQAVGGAVLVDGGAADDGEHLVAVAAGVGEAFHDEEADALGPAGAVGARRRTACSGRRRRARRCRVNSTKEVGVDITVTPPASAREHSPLRSAWAAMWRATSEEEQAVSTVTAGPSRPKV